MSQRVLPVVCLRAPPVTVFQCDTFISLYHLTQRDHTIQHSEREIWLPTVSFHKSVLYPRLLVVCVWVCACVCVRACVPAVCVSLPFVAYSTAFSLLFLLFSL